MHSAALINLNMNMNAEGLTAGALLLTQARPGRRCGPDDKLVS